MNNALIIEVIVGALFTLLTFYLLNNNTVTTKQPIKPVMIITIKNGIPDTTYNYKLTK